MKSPIEILHDVADAFHKHGFHEASNMKEHMKRGAISDRQARETLDDIHKVMYPQPAKAAAAVELPEAA